MTDSSPEHDFFGADDSADAAKKPAMEKKKSFREISRMSPEVIKTVMATTATAGGSKQQSTSPPPLPVLVTDMSAPSGVNKKDVAPLTIFYNGAVAVFDLPQEKAEDIIKLVEEEADADHHHN